VFGYALLNSHAKVTKPALLSEQKAIDDKAQRQGCKKVSGCEG
jgi:hypothetical protein